HVITADEHRGRGLALGAMTYLDKSITRDNLSSAFEGIRQSLQVRAKRLLIVSAHEFRLTGWRAALGGADVEIFPFGTTPASLASVKRLRLDGVVIDLALSEVPIAQLIEAIQDDTAPHTPPIVLHGRQGAGFELEAEIIRLARHSAIRFVDSAERL